MYNICRCHCPSTSQWRFRLFGCCMQMCVCLVDSSNLGSGAACCRGQFGSLSNIGQQSIRLKSRRRTCRRLCRGRHLWLFPRCRIRRRRSCSCWWLLWLDRGFLLLSPNSLGPAVVDWFHTRHHISWGTCWWRFGCSNHRQGRNRLSSDLNDLWRTSSSSIGIGLGLRC
jgi:hypothetical protein